MPEFLFGPVPHTEAAAFIADKRVVSRDVFNGLLPELRSRAFVISGMQAADAVQAVRDRIAELPQGSKWDDVKKDIAAKISAHLVDPTADANTRDGQLNASNRRAELLLRTHGFQAYQSAAYKVMDRQRDVFPFWQYLTMHDGRVRPSHAALNGIVLPHDSPFWAHHYPPWDFGCRCQVVPLSPEDKDDIQSQDAGKPPEAQRVLEGAAETELVQNNRLVRGPNNIVNVAPPPPNKWHWHPGDQELTAADLKSRYDADIYDKFEVWAKQTKVSSRKTVWQWIGGDKAAAPVGAPAPAPAWPTDPAQLKTVKALGGSTGATLVEDGAGKQFVLKKGNSPDHIREEFAADQAYRALGIKVPEARLYNTPAGPVKLAEHIQGTDLGAYLAKATPAEAAAVKAEVATGFAADALLGNWDVAGMNLDNILVDASGAPWRIDNGGSLRFRAMGKAKTADEWNDHATEIWTMRDPAVNAQTGKLLAGLDIFQIARQIEAIDRTSLLGALPADVHAVVGARRRCSARTRSASICCGSFILAPSRPPRLRLPPIPRRPPSPPPSPAPRSSRRASRASETTPPDRWKWCRPPR